MTKHYMTKEEIRKLGERNGFTLAGPDHPVYKEGPTIMLLSHLQGRQKQPGTISPQRSSAKDLDSIKTNNSPLNQLSQNAQQENLEAQKEERQTQRVLEAGYSVYLRTTQDNPPKTIEGYKEMRDAEDVY